MISNVDNILESWLAALGGDASGWLAAFLASPRQAVSDLLWDAFYFGPLNIVERSQLASNWLDYLGNSEQFAERLDAAFAAWIEENWGRFDHRAESLVSAWSCLCRVIEFSSKLHEDSHLKNSAAALRARFTERQQFLGSFSSAPAADPLGLYLAVIAEFQGEDRSLAAFWHRMCDLPDDVLFYHARYAMLGLRRLKAAIPSEDGTLRAEVVLGLLRMARAFDRLVRERDLPEHIARSTFRRVAAQTAAAYPKSPRWVAHGLSETLELPERVQRWLLAAVPPLAEAVQREKKKTTHYQSRPRRSIEPDPNWSRRGRDLAARLGNGDRKCLPDAERLLDEERHYAEATGDTYDLIRSLCSFAIRVLRLDPAMALRWAEEALKREPDNDYSWNTVRTVLLRQQRLRTALGLAWVAWKRFPNDVVARAGLAEVLKATRRYDEAEHIYRETIARFPNDVVARAGLAEILKATRRYDEAEHIYRETIARFPDNAVARNGLADTLRRARRYDEAEDDYRRIIKSGRANQATFIGLANLILRKGESGRAEALDLLAQTLKFDPHNSYAHSLQQRLMVLSDNDLAPLMSEWEEVADDSFESSALIIGEDEGDAESQAAPESGAERQRLPIQPKATLDAETDAPAENNEIRSNEPVTEPSPETEPAISLEPQAVMPEDEPVTDHIGEIATPGFKLSDSFEIASLIAEAYFYRTWAKGADQQTATARRQQAAALLEQAQQLSPQDPHVLAERAALAVDEGDESAVYQSLTVQLTSHPAAVPLLVLKARLDRERAQKEGRQLNEARLAELWAIPERLHDLNLALIPLSHFQKGLAALALLDGAVRSANAAQSFNRFRRTMAHRATEEKKAREHARNPRDVLQFHEWLQQRTNKRFFASLTESEEVCADDIPIIESALAQHYTEVIEVEDVFADRIAFSAV